MSLPSKSIVSSLLSAAAGSLLAAHSVSALAIITSYNENTDIAGADFSNTLAGANSLPGALQISGDLDGGFLDPDFFKTSLAPGTFTLGITYNNAINTLTVASITARDDSGTAIGNMVFSSNTAGSSTGTITGTVPANGFLVVDIQQSAEGTGSSYSMNLSVVPEPETATVALLGAAAAAIAARSRKKVS